MTNFEKWRKKLSEATNAYNFMSVIEAMTLEFGESNKSIPFSDWRFTEWLKQEAETKTED